LLEFPPVFAAGIVAVLAVFLRGVAVVPAFGILFSSGIHEI